MKKMICVLVLLCTFGFILPAQEYFISIDAKDTGNNPITGIVANYYGDYEGSENPPYTIGPYSEPFTVTLTWNYTAFAGSTLFYWEVDGVQQEDGEHSIEVQADNPGGNEVVLVFQRIEHPSPPLTNPPTPTVTPDPNVTPIVTVVPTCAPCAIAASGYVTTVSGEPIEGATITMTTAERENQTATDSEGYYSIAVPSCTCAEDAVFTVSKEGYISIEETHHVSFTTINFVLSTTPHSGGQVWFEPYDVVHTMLNFIYLAEGIPTDLTLIPSTILGDFKITNEVHLNTGTQLLAAYGMTIQFDPSVVIVNSGEGSNGVSAGPESFVAAVNASESGSLVVSGFDVNGVGPASNFHMFTINWLAQTYDGTTDLTITIDNLVDENTSQIGIPSAQTGTITIETMTCVLGDLNSNGTINIVDALLLAQYYVGLNPQNTNILCGDVNCDGSINIIDALIIAQYYVGLITDFCREDGS